MLRATAVFNTSISEARALTGLYDFLSQSITSPYSFDDILRSQIVYGVSAFDKLIHDLVRIGMVATFVGTRTATPKYLSEVITIELHGALISATIPPKELVFEQEVIRKLRLQTFHDPTKIADGLSFIWTEAYKWQKIAAAMGRDAEDAKRFLKLIATRRNAIVHESDIDPISHTKTPITRAECNEITDFLSRCGNAIAGLVI